MDFDLSEEQRLLKDSVDGLLGTLRFSGTPCSEPFLPS